MTCDGCEHSSDYWKEDCRGGNNDINDSNKNNDDNVGLCTTLRRWEL